MKNIFTPALLVFTLCAASCATSRKDTTPSVAKTAPATLPALSPLRVEGRRIVNAAGEEVRLRGVNAGNWLLIEPWMIRLEGHPDIVAEKDIWDLLDKRFGREKKLELIRAYRENFFKESDVRRIADLGLNCLRVPIWWRAVSDPEYGGDWSYLDRVVSWCAEQGVYVVPDLHGAPGGQSNQGAIVGEQTDADLWNEDRFKEQSVEWWKQAAERYKGNPVIAGFDLLNEAVSASMDDLVDLYDRMYHAVRAIDPERILIIEDGLLGFHRLPRPFDMGWENVIYSIHYYPQDRDEAFNAPERDMHRMNHSAMWFNVPTYMGEFNTIQLDRGGVASFLRHIEVFDFFGWSWTWWSYKKIEDNLDYNWGLTGYLPEVKPINLHEDSFESIRDAFASFRTEALHTHPLMEAALRQPVRWPAAPDESGAIRLGLDTVYLFAESESMRYEWGRSAPNIGYWGPDERVAWPVEITEDGTYELGLRFANRSGDNVARVWVDGVLIEDVPLPNTGGWEKYQPQALTPLHLPRGRRVIEIGQSDSEDGFINLRDGWLKKTDQAATKALESAIRLHPLNAEPLRKGAPLRVEWGRNPPNFGFWASGEGAAWTLRLGTGGDYRCSISYSTPSPATEASILLNGEGVWHGVLPTTGGWHEFADEKVDMIVRLVPGEHRFEFRWETPHGTDAGNVRGINLIRLDN